MWLMWRRRQEGSQQKVMVYMVIKSAARTRRSVEHCGQEAPPLMIYIRATTLIINNGQVCNSLASTHSLWAELAGKKKELIF